MNIISMIWLKALVPYTSPTYRVLFSSGSVYPYNTISSLRFKYFFPWTAIPNLKMHNPLTPWVLYLVRFSAWLSVFLLFSLVALGILILNA